MMRTGSRVARRQHRGEREDFVAMTHVAVLYGGISAEREVSRSTGIQVIAALRDAGFIVTPIEVDRRHRGCHCRV